MSAIHGREVHHLIVFDRFVCSTRRRSNEIKVLGGQVNPRLTSRLPRVGERLSDRLPLLVHGVKHCE
jgi:hypothetical protein